MKSLVQVLMEQTDLEQTPYSIWSFLEEQLLCRQESFINQDNLSLIFLQVWEKIQLQDLIKYDTQKDHCQLLQFELKCRKQCKNMPLCSEFRSFWKKDAIRLTRLRQPIKTLELRIEDLFGTLIWLKL